MNNSDMPAMPAIAMNNEECLSALDFDAKNAGLTKREHFAGLAMQTFDLKDYSGPNWAKDLAADSLDLADALLAELEKGNG